MSLDAVFSPVISGANIIGVFIRSQSSRAEELPRPIARAAANRRRGGFAVEKRAKPLSDALFGRGASPEALQEFIHMLQLIRL